MSMESARLGHFWHIHAKTPLELLLDKKISHIFSSPTDKMGEQSRETIYITALSFNMRGLPAPLVCGLKRYEG